MTQQATADEEKEPDAGKGKGGKKGKSGKAGGKASGKPGGKRKRDGKVTQIRSLPGGRRMM